MLGTGTNGLSFAEKVLTDYPNTSISLMSGNPESVMVDADHKKFSLLKKPFSSEGLFQSIREATGSAS
jgi:DNA-binding NtrC family response regulator